MAVVIITTHADGGDEYVKNASNYPTNEDSVLAKGYGVTMEDPNTAQMQFTNTAKFWNNQNKNPFIHFTCSFTPDEVPNAETAMAITDKALDPFKNDHLILLGTHQKAMENSDYHSHSFIHTTNYNNGSMIYADNKTTFPVAQRIADMTGEVCTLIKKQEGNMKKDFRQKFYPRNSSEY